MLYDVDVAKQPVVPRPKCALDEIPFGNGFTADKWLRHDGTVARSTTAVTSPDAGYPQRHASVTLDVDSHASVTLGGLAGGLA